jgi:hypothetical protein
MVVVDVVTALTKEGCPDTTPNEHIKNNAKRDVVLVMNKGVFFNMGMVLNIVKVQFSNRSTVV